MKPDKPTILLPDGSPITPSSDGERSLVVIDRVRPTRLFLLPYTTTNLMPGLLAPFHLKSDVAKRALEEAERLEGAIGLVPVRDEAADPPRRSDLYDVGLMGRIARTMNLPDESRTALIHVQERIRIDRIVRMEPIPVAEVIYPPETADGDPVELKVLMRSIINGVKQISRENPFITEELKLVMVNLDQPARLADVVASVLQLEMDDYLDLLRLNAVKPRLQRVLDLLSREIEMADLQRRVQAEVNERMQRSQREFYLREQLREIQRELGKAGGEGGEEGHYEKRIREAGLPPAAEKIAVEELEKLMSLHESSPEYSVSRSYLDWLLALPWNRATEENLDVGRAERVLAADHYGLEEVKTRILEYLAVLQLTRKPTGTILCLVGPPGVGKTSLGRSIARAMGRQFIRFSVGGMRDEAEIKGHRRTYIGAMPGKLIQEIKKAGASNPVFMLDEIDKLAPGHQGDPASALLEALDPEQNAAFLDHYIDTPFDLSKVFFITTANTLDTIPGPLLDRMEVIRLPGYIEEEKMAIGRRYLLPRQRRRHGLKARQLTIEAAAVRAIIRDYTQEAGLRAFEREIEKICRKVAARSVRGFKGSVRVGPGDLKPLLGAPRLFTDKAGAIADVGVATGLAWTPVGGVILFIESNATPESQGTITLTGSVGAVMSESASLAFTYVKSVAQRFGVQPDWFSHRAIHLHLPAGATPKDGPSAGVAMAASLLGLATGRTIDTKTAMTGELTLTGKVLPVGGLKEKVIAAHRAGIKRILLPRPNERDLEEIPAAIRSKLTFVPIETAEDAFAVLWPPSHPKARSPRQPERAAPRGSARRRPAAPPPPGRAVRVR